MKQTRRETWTRTCSQNGFRAARLMDRKNKRGQSFKSIQTILYGFFSHAQFLIFLNVNLAQALELQFSATRIGALCRAGEHHEVALKVSFPTFQRNFCSRTDRPQCWCVLVDAQDRRLLWNMLSAFGKYQQELPKSARLVVRLIPST